MSLVLMIRLIYMLCFLIPGVHIKKSHVDREASAVRTKLVFHGHLEHVLKSKHLIRRILLICCIGNQTSA